jgi:hypothetical protein
MVMSASFPQWEQVGLWKTSAALQAIENKEEFLAPENNWTCLNKTLILITRAGAIQANFASRFAGNQTT